MPLLQFIVPLNKAMMMEGKKSVKVNSKKTGRLANASKHMLYAGDHLPVEGITLGCDFLMIIMSLSSLIFIVTQLMYDVVTSFSSTSMMSFYVHLFFHCLVHFDET